MKKLLVLAILMFLVFSAYRISCAQTLIFQEQPNWLLGSWIGIIDRQTETRTLEITEIKENTTTQDNKTLIDGVANYGVTGKQMHPIAVTFVIFPTGNAILSFNTPVNANVSLSCISITRMEGTFRAVKGKPQGIRFWKTGTSSANIDPKIKGFLGTWKGEWANGLEAHATIEYIDSNAASLRYEWGNLAAENIAAGWAWQNARITERGALEFIFPASGRYPSRTFVLQLSSNQKNLNGELFYSGPQSVNSIRMSRK